MRARITFSTVGGISTATSWSNRQPPRPSCTSAPASASDRTSSSRKNGLPSAGSRIRCSMSAGSVPAPTSGVQQLAAASPESASRASSRMRCGSSRAASSLQPPRAVVALRPRGEDEQERGAPRCRRSSRSQQLQRGGVGPVQVLERDHDAGRPRRAARSGRARPRTSGTAGPRATARRDGPRRRARASARAARRGTGRARRRRSPNSRSTCAAQRDAHAQLGLVGAGRRARAEQVAERPVRHRLAVGDAAPSSQRGRPCAARRLERARAARRGAGSCRSRARRVRTRTPPGRRARRRRAVATGASSRSRPTSGVWRPRARAPRDGVAEPRRPATPRPARPCPSARARRRSPQSKACSTARACRRRRGRARLGGRLQPGRDVHRVADRRVLHPAPAADRARRRPARCRRRPGRRSRRCPTPRSTSRP